MLDRLPFEHANLLPENDFLQLLVTQMENQDPLDPQSDTQMAAEMAQFTSLQETSAMSSSLSIYRPTTCWAAR